LGRDEPWGIVRRVVTDVPRHHNRFIAGSRSDNVRRDDDNGGVIPSIDAASVPTDAYLLDVREQDEWDAGHVEGSQHIPIGELLGRLGEVPADREVVVVCRVGSRSAQVTAYLGQQGYDVVNLDGGLDAWVDAGRPLVAEAGAPPCVL
jgi:rhodanese-related sulfurtransferase